MYSFDDIGIGELVGSKIKEIVIERSEQIGILLRHR